MITKMTKYSFVLLTGEKEGFLEQLQELGVVDISRSVKPIDSDSSVMFHKAERARKTLEFLESIDYSKDADAEAIAKTTANIEGDPVDFIEECRAKITELHIAKANAEKQLNSRLPWGEYDKKALDGLKDLGYAVRYYSVDAKKFDETWGELYPLQIVSNDGKKVWFVTIAPKGEAYRFPLQEIAAPEGTYAESVAELARIKAETIECKAGLLNAKDYIPAIKEACNRDLVNLDLYLAKEAGEGAAEDMITVFTGFAPIENDAELVEAFDKMGVLYIKEEAVLEDNPPIKLKNNWFTRQFEVFTEMYGAPVYTEFDPTPIVAPFYLLFFAMCMGDAGYGLILILLGIAVAKKWINIAMLKNIGPIISILGAGTLVIGLVLGTAFGIDLSASEWYPEAMKKIMITGTIAGFPAQMILALGIGVFHICLAMTVKAIGYTKRFGFRETVSVWGWLLLIVGGIATGALGMAKLVSPAVIKWIVIVIGVVSALGIYIFNTPGKNPLSNIGSGLWDTYNMVTGILGDVLSYIRLYALGLAGGMLGQAFNILGGIIVGDGISVINFLPFALILLFGHSLNLAMSCLGAFVHPLRLTFVEYFKNAGYEGKGKEYNPLTKEKNY
ncbi:MAG: ATPase V [Bacteroidales bacterium]|nr:ATPase V [Bacteroidales bacterium]